MCNLLHVLSTGLDESVEDCAQEGWNAFLHSLLTQTGAELLGGHRALGVE